MKKRICATAFCGIMALNLTMAPAAFAEEAVEHTEPAYVELDLAKALEEGTYAWELFDEDGDGTDDYYYLLNVAYCGNVTTPLYQSMNIYVSTFYMEETDGKVTVAEGLTQDVEVAYTADTAPVVFANECSGWRSSTPIAPGGWFSIKQFTDEGMIYISCGARSRDDTNGETEGEDYYNYGKMPTPIVDLKSGVIYLKANTEALPGDTEKIVSIGTSGGGQMSSILGASGNMEEYYPYLYENGAIGVEYDEASDTYTSAYDDSVYGCNCFCPIADIENADLAYAWMHFDDGITQFLEMGAAEASQMTEFQIELQNDMAYAFAEYINGLGLVDEDGNVLSFDENEDGTLNLRSGSYYEAVLENMSAALAAYLDAMEETDQEAYVAGLLESNEEGQPWIEELEDGSLAVRDMAAFMNAVIFTTTDRETQETITQSLGEKRNKNVPGFDTFWMTAEGDGFGYADQTAVHFSASVATLLEENYEKYQELEGFEEADVDDFIQQVLYSEEAEHIADQLYLMNATQILLEDAAGTQDSTPAQYWRTRNGTADEHTAFTIAWDLCLAANMAGCETDYSLVWAMTHGSNEGDTTGTFIEWTNAICQ